MYLMKILVTGATGFIGSHTAERLSELGHEVVGVDNFNDYYDIDLKQMNAKSIKEKFPRKKFMTETTYLLLRISIHKPPFIFSSFPKNISPRCWISKTMTFN